MKGLSVLNGLLNIQVRVLSREAQALLKQLEKEIAAVDRATNGQSSASKSLAISQENLRNQTRSLSAAQTQLAASQRAVTAAQRANETANTKVTAAQAAYTRSLQAASAAVAKKIAMEDGNIKQQAAAAMNADRLTAANERLVAAEHAVTNAELAHTRATERLLAKPSQAAIDAEAIALRRLEVAYNTALRAERSLDAARSTSVQSAAKAAVAADAMAVAQDRVVIAQQRALAAAAALTAAYARVGASEVEITAAAGRAAVAQNELTVAEERATIAAAAAERAQIANAASMTAAGAAATGAAAGGFAKAVKGFTQIANQSQWAGRQLQTNFTMPFLIAGGFAIKFALDNEKAMVMLSKVYGTDPTKNYKAELDALGKSMELLSVKYGVQQKDVISIGASWAAAGAEGAALAHGVEQTLRTMVVGEMDAVDATKALISIQAQWRLNTKQLTATMNMLNTVENQTGVTLKDLVDGFARASGSARQMGVTQQELAADIAALVPAAGSAAAAGNGLKTIYSKLIAPTNDAVKILHRLGVETDKGSWSNLTASQRLKVLTNAYATAGRAQKDIADKTIFGNYQLSRASILLEAIAKSEGYRQRALDNTGNALINAKIADQELQKVLDSNPQKLKQLGVILQNTAADVGTKLVPALMAVASIITSVAIAFNKLDPTVRKLIIGFFLFVAVMGPVLRMLGAFGTLIGWTVRLVMGIGGAMAFAGRAVLTLLAAPFMILSRVLIGTIMTLGRVLAVVRGLPAAFAAARAAIVAFFAAFRLVAALTGIWSAILGVAGAGMAGLLSIVGGGLAAVGSFLIGWPGLILLAVVAVLFILKDQIKGVFTGFKKTLSDQAGVFRAYGAQFAGVFNKLPQGIQNAMLAVVRIVRAAVLAVYHLFSYLNPFAHHSPSLVENVTNGMAAVASEFGKLPKAVGDPISKAYADIAKFKNATKDLMAGFDKLSQKKDYEALLKVDPDGAVAFKLLAADLDKLNPKLDALEKKQKAQQVVVDAWKTKVDAATAALEVQEKVLDGYKNTADAWSKKLDAAQASLEKFTSTPITGFKAMEDQIFANSQAQKALQLQMMQMEDAVGPIDDLQSRMASLAGEIEKVRGEQTDLRTAGAGSDVLNTYNDQIAALEQQQGALGDTANQYNDLKKQLEALAHAGQELDLQKSLNFDGLQRQIDDASKSIDEMDFADIIAGVTDAKNQVDLYKQQLEDSNKIVDDQQKIVDELKNKRDALQLTYDAEQKKLDAITTSYEKLRDVVQDIKQAMSDVASVSSQVKKVGGKGGSGGSLSPAEQNFADAAGGDFPISGGTSDIGREGGLPDIDQFNKDLQSQMKGLTDSLDMFAPIKKQWAKFKGWWGSNVAGPIKSMFKELVPGTDIMSPLMGSKAQYQDTPFFTSLKEIPTKIGEIFHSPQMTSVGDGIGKVFTLLGNIVKLFLPDIKDLAGIIRDNLVKAFVTWKPQVENIVKALGRLWTGISPIVAIIGGALLLVLKVAAGIFTEVFGRALDAVIDLIGDALQILSGLINFVAFIFTGQWSAAWDAVKQIFLGVFEAIWHFLEGIVSIVWGIIKGFVEGIVGFFQWLWDVLVGHSIIPDMCNAIVSWFLGLPGKILDALVTLGGKLVDLIKAAWALFMSALKTAWDGTMSFIKSLPGKIYDGFMLYVNLVTSIGSKIIGWIKDGLVNAWSAVSGWVGEKITWVVSKFGSIKDSLSGKFSGMFDGIKEAFRSAINFVIRGWNSLDFKVPEVDTHIPGVGKVGGFSIGVPDIPYLAKGGGAIAGSPYIVGEVGPELFVPGATGQVFSNANLQDLITSATKESLSMLAGAGVGATVRSAVPGEYAAMAAQADRRVSMASTGGATVQSQTVNNNTEYHFHGDLSFPNITSGEDAESFLTNLSDLAG